MNMRPPMDRLSFDGQATREPTLLIAQDPTRAKRRSGLAWWHRFTAPKEVPDTAPLPVRERVRRGLLISTAMFYASILFLLGTIIGIFGPLHFIAVATTFSLIVLAIASQLNRAGYTNAAGLMIPLGFNLALVAVVLIGPLTPSSIQLYDLLVFVEVFAASFLPPRGWIIALFAIINIAFIQLDITFQPHTQAFAAVLATDMVAIRLRPTIIHIVISGIFWLWVRSANDAIARADRAEVIANLEHTVAEQERVEAQKKRQLDESIKAIVETHMRVANGDLSSRVPLSSGNVLWQVAGPLNNLLARFQNMQHHLQEMRKMEQEYVRTREALANVIYRIKSTKAGRRVPLPTQTGTLVDNLVQEVDPLLPPHDPSRLL